MLTRNSSSKISKFVIFVQKNSHFLSKLTLFQVKTWTQMAQVVVSLSNLVTSIKKLLMDIVNCFNYSYLCTKISEKWPFQNFNAVLYQTGKPFFGKILKNRFFSIHIHKTHLHLRVEKNQRIFFLTVTIASHGPLTDEVSPKGN